ncbi:MAG: 50S ribosomal protein L35 [Xanthomonadales bacterium]|nr:50S ribosomal protein L35 [Xanthomonadales bacterium]
MKSPRAGAERHILTKKSQKRKRGLRGTGMIADADQKSIKRMLPHA